MFITSVIQDTIQIQPYNFGKGKYEALTDEINRKYANKVLQEVGLCICLHDILTAGEEFVYPGRNGISFVKVKFRLIVFRPFIGEVLVGKIKSCLSDEIRVTLGFFDDIKIPKALLRNNTVFDNKDQAYVWKHSSGDFWMDRDEEIRFRVVGETFTDITPTQIPGNNDAQDVSNPMIIGGAGNSSRTAPYELTCSAQEDGLGLVSWWVES